MKNSFSFLDALCVHAAPDTFISPTLKEILPLEEVKFIKCHNYTGANKFSLHEV